MREMKASAALIYATFSLLTVGAAVALVLGTAAPVAAQTKAQTKFNPKDGLTYVLIPPGTFLMGCSHDDSECEPNEKMTRSVTITKGFWIGQTPVTQGAYMKVTGTNPSKFKGDDKLPVEKVDWTSAGKYCQQVDMRLPTEAEWEYAARGGKPGARYGELDAIAWYFKNAMEKTHDVGQKQPNAYGLYDMLGNVWQWTASLMDNGHELTVMLRGGSWYVPPKGRWWTPGGPQRITQNYPLPLAGSAMNRLATVGFRCVKDE